MLVTVSVYSILNYIFKPYRGYSVGLDSMAIYAIGLDRCLWWGLNRVYLGFRTLYIFCQGFISIDMVAKSYTANPHCNSRV